MARTIRNRIPKWQLKHRDHNGQLLWSDCLWANRDLTPNGWSHQRVAKNICQLLSRPAVRWATQHYLKDPDGNTLPLSAKKLTASEFEYYQ
jgi:hypothetical protein